MRLPKKKSDVVKCIYSSGNDVTEAPKVDSLILDGGTIANMSPNKGLTFDDYASNTFVPYIRGLLHNSNRLDLVWNRYFVDSLKESTRAKRGLGIRRKVHDKAPLPTNWRTFLRCSENKTELFLYLSLKLKEVKGKADSRDR